MDDAHIYEKFVSRAIGNKNQLKFNDPGLMASSEEFELAKSDIKRLNDVKATIAYCVVAIKHNIDKDHAFLDNMIDIALKCNKIADLMNIIFQVKKRIEF